jgi:hypothetical protein
MRAYLVQQPTSWGGAGLQDLHGADAVAGQGERGTEPGLPGAEDEDVERALGGGGHPVVVVADEGHVRTRLVCEGREVRGGDVGGQGFGTVAVRFRRVGRSGLLRGGRHGHGRHSMAGISPSATIVFPAGYQRDSMSRRPRR